MRLRLTEIEAQPGRRYLAANLDRLVMAEYDNAPPEYISFSKNG